MKMWLIRPLPAKLGPRGDRNCFSRASSFARGLFPSIRRHRPASSSLSTIGVPGHEIAYAYDNFDNPRPCTGPLDPVRAGVVVNTAFNMAGLCLPASPGEEARPRSSLSAAPFPRFPSPGVLSLVAKAPGQVLHQLAWRNSALTRGRCRPLAHPLGDWCGSRAFLAASRERRRPLAVRHQALRSPFRGRAGPLNRRGCWAGQHSPVWRGSRRRPLLGRPLYSPSPRIKRPLFPRSISPACAVRPRQMPGPSGVRLPCNAASIPVVPSFPMKRRVWAQLPNRSYLRAGRPAIGLPRPSQETALVRCWCRQPLPEILLGPAHRFLSSPCSANRGWGATVRLAARSQPLGFPA